MANWVLLLIAVIAVAVWLLWFLQASKERTKLKSLPRAETARSTGKYQSVSIRYGIDPCEAVEKLSGKRFLSEEAPPLPLPDCSAARCQCWYVHVGDRRVDDRRDPYRPTSYGGPDRRSGTDRRRPETVPAN